MLYDCVGDVMDVVFPVCIVRCSCTGRVSVLSCIFVCLCLVCILC